MVVHGHVHNGVVVLEPGAALPEGAAVSVTFPAQPASKVAAEKRRIQVPLVHTDKPGTVALSGERIAEVMDAEDASPRH